MRVVLSCAVACLTLGATALPARSGPDAGVMRVLVTKTGMAGILKGECVSTPLPATDPSRVDHLVALAAVTNYAAPPLVARCWIEDSRTSVVFSSVDAISVGVAAAGAGIVPVPSDAQPRLCFVLTAGGQGSDNPRCTAGLGAVRSAG